MSLSIYAKVNKLSGSLDGIALLASVVAGRLDQIGKSYSRAVQGAINLKTDSGHLIVISTD